MPLHPSLIEPAIPLDARQRRAVTKAAWRRWYKKPIHSTIYAVGLLLCIMSFNVMPDLIESIVGEHRWYHTLGAFGIYLGLIYGLYMIMRRFHFAPCVYAELRDRGYDVCPKCGYWLRDLDVEVHRCPECGRERAK